MSFKDNGFPATVRDFLLQQGKHKRQIVGTVSEQEIGYASAAVAIQYGLDATKSGLNYIHPDSTPLVQMTFSSVAS